MKMDGPVIRPGMVCWSCRHFWFSGGSGGYSEYTPGYAGSMSCAKNVWDAEMEGMHEDKLRELLTTAERCTNFEQRKHS